MVGASLRASFFCRSPSPGTAGAQCGGEGSLRRSFRPEQFPCSAVGSRRDGGGAFSKLPIRAPFGKGYRTRGPIFLSRFSAVVLGYVDLERSRRARCAKRLSKEEKRRLRKELRENPRLKSTAAFAREYGVAPSTIRYYRKRWRVEYSWHVAMALPGSVKRRKQIAEATRVRSLLMWKERKKKMLESFLKKKMLARSSGGGKSSHTADLH